VEFTVVRVSRKPIKPGDFWAVHDRMYPFPVKREVVVLDLPADRAVAFWADPAHAFNTIEEGGRRVRTWELARESYRPKGCTKRTTTRRRRSSARARFLIGPR
jgi:hypothetical protein